MIRSTRLGLIAGIALAVPLIVSGCTPDSPDSPDSPDAASPVGTWGSTAEGEPHLIISEDGSLGGNDGCNTMFGNWSDDGNGIGFSEVGGTLMFCEGVDTWLSQMDSATIEGDEMHIRDDGGAEIGSLAKQ